MAGRKRFQIHLPTAVLLMFVAGGLIWANVPIGHSGLAGDYFTTDTPERHPEIIDETEFLKMPNRLYLIGRIYSRYGWPVPVSWTKVPVRMDRDGRITPLSPQVRLWEGTAIMAIVANVLFAGLVLWMIFRWIERRVG